MEKEIKNYILQFDEKRQEKLLKVYEIIRNNVPDETTEIFSWAMPTFYLNGNLIHFAMGKNHIGIYPGADGVAHFEPKLSAYKHSKGAIQFPLDKEIPEKLLRDIVKYRVKINTKVSI